MDTCTPIFGKRLREEINGRSNVESEYWRLQSLVVDPIWPHCRQTMGRDRYILSQERCPVALLPKHGAQSIKGTKLSGTCNLPPYRHKVHVQLSSALSDVMRKVYRCVVVWEPGNKVRPSEYCSPLFPLSSTSSFSSSPQSVSHAFL